MQVLTNVNSVPTKALIGIYEHIKRQAHNVLLAKNPSYFIKKSLIRLYNVGVIEFISILFDMFCTPKLSQAFN